MNANHKKTDGNLHGKNSAIKSSQTIPGKITYNDLQENYQKKGQNKSNYGLLLSRQIHSA